MSNTLLVVEVHGLNVPWTRSPRHYASTSLLRDCVRAGISPTWPVYDVAMADAQRASPVQRIDPETLPYRLAIINNGQPSGY